MYFGFISASGVPFCSHFTTLPFSTVHSWYGHSSSGEKLDGIVQLPLDVGPQVVGVARIPLVAPALGEVHDDLGIVARLRGRLHALDRRAHGAGGTLRGAGAVQLDPVGDGQDDVGELGGQRELDLHRHGNQIRVRIQPCLGVALDILIFIHIL